MSGYFASVNDVYGRDFTKNFKSAAVCDPAVALLNPSDDYSFPYEKYNRTYEASSKPDKKVVTIKEDVPKPFSLTELRKRVVTNDVPQESGDICERETVSIAEIFLYILSGIMVILMMEQVLQVGIHMGKGI